MYKRQIETTKIPADRIGELIGPGGKNIKAIQAEYGADINIEEDGTVQDVYKRQVVQECHPEGAPVGHFYVCGHVDAGYEPVSVQFSLRNH